MTNTYHESNLSWRHFVPIDHHFWSFIQSKPCHMTIVAGTGGQPSVKSSNVSILGWETFAVERIYIHHKSMELIWILPVHLTG